MVEFANSAGPDEAPHNEPPHLDLQCLPSSLQILNMIYLGQNPFFFLSLQTNFVSFKVNLL